MERIEGAVAFITGGAGGVGLGMAEALGRAGARIMIADVDAPAVAPAVDRLRSQGIDADGLTVDVADRAAMVEAATRTVDRFGRAHILCNNAGIGMSGRVGEIAPGDWDWIVDVNLYGVIHGTEAFLPHLLAHGEGGQIVNTASMSGLMASALTEPYAATKYAVVGLSQAWRGELAPRGIGVSVLCPGMTRSRIHEGRRTRSARYGPDPRPDRPLVEGVDMAGMLDRAVPADVVGARVVEAIRADEPFILPHPEYEPFVRRRLDAILAAFDRAAQSDLLPGRTTFGLPQSMAADPLAATPLEDAR